MSHKTLGTFKCISGKEDEHYKYLLDTSDKIAELAKINQFTKQQAWLGYNCCYIPAMTYSLPTVSMTEKQLTYIQQKATTRFTQLCGYESTFPKAIVHAPIALGGLGLHSLYVKSNINKIESIMCNINKNPKLGKSMMITVNLIQIHTGSKVSYLENNTNIDYIQDNWFLEIRQCLQRGNTTINVQNIWQPRELRKYD
jgi:hypothetical protein